jgi:hypothetical protein
MRSKADILAECVDALLVGKDSDTVLKRYPECVDELSALMSTVRKVRAASNSFQVLVRPEEPPVTQRWRGAAGQPASATVNQSRHHRTLT